MKFKVITSDRAAKEIKKLDKKDRIRIYKEIQRLEDPFSLDIKKIKDRIYRIRAGKFRIIIEIDFENRIVWVAKVDKRERIYDRI